MEPTRRGAVICLSTTDAKLENPASCGSHKKEGGQLYLQVVRLLIPCPSLCVALVHVVYGTFFSRPGGRPIHSST